MIGRRRFFSIAGGAAASALFGAPAPVLASAGVYQWKGIALGAEAHILMDGSAAVRLVKTVLSEIDRLENIFSLYRPNSAISQLNREGVLSDPAFDLLSVLSLCDSLHNRTGGVFDPTVQPLWHLYADCRDEGRVPTPAELNAVRHVVGWQRVSYTPRQVRFEHPGMALTFNGIAQGYIADRIAQLLRDNGVRNVLLNLGEVRAIGTRPTGEPWQVGISTPGHDQSLGGFLTVRDGAVAVSEPMGTILDHEGTTGHILSPSSGLSEAPWRQVVVQAPSAALADGLSTAFCLMSQEQIDIAARGISVRTLA